MSDGFFERPILNSPYAYPGRHWDLDQDGQPTNKIVSNRRRSELLTPVPKPQRRRRTAGQGELGLGAGDGISTADQEYNPTPIINEMRTYVDAWRQLPNPDQWQVTPETARLLQHWRHHQFQAIRPFFCQVEAVETMIWLTEVAPKRGSAVAKFWTHVRAANAQSNPELVRLALKLATGAGKTTVMAMLIAWQTVNALRHPGSRQFSRAFLVITPGITIKDRLRVLLPNDPDSYYRDRDLVPVDMLGDIERAKIVVTNYHAFRRRERLEVSKTGRALLQGRGPNLTTIETEGEMLRRAVGDLMGLKNVVVLNDEAHHCYREKPHADTADDLKGEEKEEAKKNNEAARLWISGIETVKRKLGIAGLYDLSATPFFLRGSGYAEGTLFPWTVSDFSLMDAIECGIVKLPRVPVADNIPGGDMPKFRNLWEHIRRDNGMPKKGRGKSGVLDPLSLPLLLKTALDALYGHYAKTFDLWQEAGTSVPPVFIVVCNNTAASKLVYDYISGFVRKDDNGTETFIPGHFELFRNHDEHGNRLARPRTLLIDSEQLESGEALDKGFRDMAADEIERFRREIVARTGDIRAGDGITDQDLLREVMNTVGKPGQLGESIRCLVSVSMLTEGWDANTVTHILGVRAFGTQLLCEQVVGRGLRRQSYDLNEEQLLNVEYADILGIPFDFTAKPVVAPPVKPRETIRVHAVRPDRDSLEITFPRVEGYRIELPEERLSAKFDRNSVLELTPDLIGPTETPHPFNISQNVEKYRPEDLAKPDTSSARTDWFSKAVFLIWHQTGQPVPYAFWTREGDIRSLDAGCIAHLWRRRPPGLDLDRDPVSGFIVSVRPTVTLREQCEQIGIENLYRRFGIEITDFRASPDHHDLGLAVGAPENPFGEEPQAPPFDLDTPIDERCREVSERVRREGAWAFRRNLLSAWDGRCAITGTALPSVLDGAHIHRYLGPQTNHLCNGLLLRTDIHRLFDLHLLGVHYHEEGRLLFTFSHRLGGSPYPQQGEIIVPAARHCRPHPEIVRRRWERFLIREQRRRQWQDRSGPASR